MTMLSIIRSEYFLSVFKIDFFVQQVQILTMNLKISLAVLIMQLEYQFFRQLKNIHRTII